MKKDSFMDLYLSGPGWFKNLIDIGEWIIIVGTALIFPHPSLPKILSLKLFGVMLILIGIYIHWLAHQVHKQAHSPKEKIEKIVTTGIYSIIRHPCYASYFFLYLGTFFIFGTLSMLIPIILFCYIFYHSALKEEKFLLEKFGKEYEKYLQKVKWRFIPKLF